MLECAPPTFSVCDANERSCRNLSIGDFVDAYDGALRREGRNSAVINKRRLI